MNTAKSITVGILYKLGESPDWSECHAIKDAPMWWHENGRTYTASGYGARIPTRHMVWFEGRWRRVYCRIYSNAGTLFIGKNPAEGYIFDTCEKVVRE